VLRRGKFLTPAARRFIASMDPDFFDKEAGNPEDAPNPTCGDTTRMTPK
jgi:hypothetical protein